MKNKILKGLALTGLLLSLAACDKKEEPKKEEKITYTLKVYDLDGEELVNKQIEETNNTSLYNSLNTNVTLKASDSSYGHYLVSINNSIVDPNYGLMIYENNQLSNVGCDEVKVNDNDVIVIKNECWNDKLDETDVLVDKVIYNYAKNLLQGFVKEDSTYKNSTFWNYILVDIARKNGYDSNLFRLDVNPQLKDSLVVEDEMDIADWGKLYFKAKAFENDIDSFKTKYSDFMTKYTEFIENIQTDYSANYAEYSLPFSITMAKTLNVTSANLEELVNTTYRPSTFYGTDALMWQLTALAAFDKVSKEDLNDIEIVVERTDVYDENWNLVGQQTNSISTALKLLPFAALGENVRAKEDTNGKDLIELLFEEFYDQASGYLKINGDTSFIVEDYIKSVNIAQIYVSLMAYKITRDLNKKVNIFA